MIADPGYDGHENELLGRRADVDRAMSMSEGLLPRHSHLVFSNEPLQETADVADDGAALKKIAKLTRCTPSIRSAPATCSTALLPLPLTEGQELKDALRFASAAAALKCTRFGGAFAASATC